MRWILSENEFLRFSIVKINEAEKKRGGLVAETSGTSLSKRDNGEDVEGIRRFRVSDDELPLTFRLLRVQGLPQWANTSCVSIGDVVQV